MGAALVNRGVPTLPGEIRWFPMAASQTFLKGQFVLLNSAGRLVECGADPAGIAGMAEAGAVEALALANKSSTATTTGVSCPITLAKRGQQFTLNTNAGVTAITHIGKKYGLTQSSGIDICDNSEETNVVFVVDAIAPEQALGTLYGRVIVEVIDSVAQLDSGTS
jgi:hypothetical protein